MALYQYHAMDADGRACQGLLGAVHLQELDARLAQRGYQLLRWRRVRFRRRSPRAWRPLLIQFCFHMELGMGAGIPILDCLRDFCTDVRDAQFVVVLERLLEAIEREGQSFSDALQEFPLLFNESFIGLIQAGEQAGRLPSVFGELHAHLKWLDEWERRMRGMSVYPLLVLFVVMAAIFILSTWLVPPMLGFLHSMGRDLPWHTRVLVEGSAWIATWWYAVVAAGAGGAIAFSMALHRFPALRMLVHTWQLRLPLVGGLIKKMLIARVITALYIMYGAGLNLLECIRISAQSSGNLALSAALQEVESQIRNGAGLAEGFHRARLFPPLVLRMIQTGERTGELEKCLRQISYFYNRDIQESCERAQTLAGPAVNVLLGLLLGWVLYALLGPVYGLALELAA